MSNVQSERNTVSLYEPCVNPGHLHAWIVSHLGVHIPRTAVCANHQSPFEYLCHTYFEPSKDVVVWAPRGGGKTRLGALATLLDLLHKPGCAIRILGGSFEQSLRMWEHLLPDLQDIANDRMVARSRASRRIELIDGSTAAVLTQSERAVRGLRVQKLRCDEVELFQPQIWQAAQLITRSIQARTCRAARMNRRTSHTSVDLTRRAADIYSGAIEAISTFHSVHGLMRQIIDTANATGRRVIRWCLLEVLEKCPLERDCHACALWEDCRGIAKTRCDGFVKIDDAIAMKHRVSREAWDAEMLCKRPSTKASVFPSFEPGVHVRDDVTTTDNRFMSLAIDFGFHNPFVCLWIADDGARVQVVDEYVQNGRTISDHHEQIESRPYGQVHRITCDPAGAGRNDQTAESNVQFLRRHGYKVHTRASRIVEGLELIRAALRPGAGDPTLFIHPRCQRLIGAMEQYHYPDSGGELPLKDGTHDHLIDALRYFYVNRSRSTGQIHRKY